MVSRPKDPLCTVRDLEIRELFAPLAPFGRQRVSEASESASFPRGSKFGSTKTAR